MNIVGGFKSLSLVWQDQSKGSSALVGGSGLSIGQ